MDEKSSSEYDLWVLLYEYGFDTMNVCTDDARIFCSSPNMRLKHRTVHRATFLFHAKTVKGNPNETEKPGLSGRHSALKRGCKSGNQWES